MRRTILTVLFTLGVVFGIGAGVFGCHARGHDRHEAFERHIADVCVAAAERAQHNHR